jgi:mRNA-degrading endonuclease RelE of RelBE toxin-antitoxin system
MAFRVLLHPRVESFLDGLDRPREELCRKALRRLEKDPYRPRPGVGIQPLRGIKKTAYRMRVGEFRFVYVVADGEVLVTDAFRRGRGYRL